MSLTITLVKGSWYNKYLNHQAEKINLPHIKENIEFPNPKKLEKIKLKGHHIKVGRLDDNHIILDDPQVSRHHCDIIKHTLGHWYVKDAGSSKGTYIETKTATVKEEAGEFELQKGDKLILANTILRIG